MILLVALLGCDTDGDGWAWPDDCDDGSSIVHPGAQEFCGGGDEDCDGVDDDGAVGLYYQDQDGDGQGDPARPFTAEQCTAPEGLAIDARDCDDQNPAIYDGATEVCNGDDDDCNGLADEADPGLDPASMTTYYGDRDGDGYGGEAGTEKCDAGTGDALFPTDCDDREFTVYPGAPEICEDGGVNDCDATETDACGFSLERLSTGASAVFSARAGAAFGGSLLLEDLNGDGAEELVAGSAAFGEESGGVFVVLGPLDRSRSLLAGTFGSAGDRFGASLAAADLDGDGVREIIVGAPGVAASAGAIYVFEGAFAEPADASFTVHGQVGVGAGERLLAPGDTNGDGGTELVVLGLGTDAAWTVWRSEGVPGTTLGDGKSSDEWSTTFGDALVDAGDVDGDGFSDVAIGDPSQSRVYLWRGDQPDVEEGFVAEPRDLCGKAALGLNDVDGDGLVDLAVACGATDEAPWMELLSWDGHAMAHVGQLVLDVAGAEGSRLALATLGDLDGDGGTDLALGIEAAGNGLVCVLSSPLAVEAERGCSLRGTPDARAFGAALLAGDVTDDGHTDLLVEARREAGDTAQLFLFPYLNP